MDTREFFNSVAFKWDEMCKHDTSKLRKIVEMSCLRKDSKILDIGTGTGILISFLLQTCPASITAVDISENMIKVAREKYNNPKVEFIAEDIMKFNRTGYDYVFIYSAYPHFKDKDGLIKHISKLTNVNGKIVIAHSEGRDTINSMHQKSEFVSSDILPPIKATSFILSKYFKVDKMIDNSEMYYISGIKK